MSDDPEIPDDENVSEETLNLKLQIMELNSGKIIAGLVEDDPDDEDNLLVNCPMMVLYTPMQITDEDGEIIAEGMRTVLLRYAMGAYHGVVGIKKQHIVMLSDTDYDFDEIFYDRLNILYPENEYDEDFADPSFDSDIYDDPEVENAVIRKSITNRCNTVDELIDRLTTKGSKTKH